MLFIKKNILIISGMIFMIGVSCNNKDCKELEIIEYFDSNRLPIINMISNSSNGCSCQINMYVMFDDYTIDSKGKIFYKDNAFYIDIETPMVNNLRYFDFEKSINEEYIIDFSINNKKYFIKASIEQKVIWKDGIEVYVFRFKDTYYYYNKSLDTIILCSKENGIIGSYLTTKEEGKSLLIAPGGEILREYIDYSNYEIRYLK